MSPTLLCVKKVASPWAWFPHKDKLVSHLHYQSEPVPGIYLVNPEGSYLVAMKPHGKKEDNKLFKTEVAFNDHERQLYMQERPTGYMSPLDYSCEPLFPVPGIRSNSDPRLGHVTNPFSGHFMTSTLVTPTILM